MKKARYILFLMTGLLYAALGFSQADKEIAFYKSKTDSFYVGEHVYLNYDGKNQTPYTFNEMKITGFDKKGFVYLSFIAEAKSAEVDQELLYYSRDKHKSGYKAGDVVNFKKTGKKVSGTILATAAGKVLITENKGFYERSYKEISKVKQFSESPTSPAILK
ncbi:MAG TPA: hypothetical protein VNY73_09705 [Bacteroidia bacterium]|nr:hypothetical protein [Bacteroidia bacterium]